MVRSMMSQTTLLKSFWDYALESAARILNMVPTKKANYVKRDTLTNLKNTATQHLFKCYHSLGYPKETMGYSFYNPSKNKVFVARNVELFESNLIDQEASRSVEDLEIIQEEDTNPFLDTSLNHEEDDQEIDEPQSDINPISIDIRAIRILIAIVVFYDYEVWQMDVKTSFLNGHLSKEFYMTQPEDITWRIPKRGTIPMQEKLKLSKSDGASTPTEKRHMSNVSYASIVGSIMYAVRCVVDWKSTKQSISTASSTDVEYIAAFDASKEAVWIRKFISGLNVVPTIEDP
ncbi:retrovirus-related pol polyprotein from transposon TNT 1-94 [Tanacetum coccineum]